MIGLDTNILVRYLIQDDPDQAQIAASIIREQCSDESPAWINRIVLCELVWVLEGVYQCPRQEIAETLKLLLETSELQVEDHAFAWSATELYRTGSADFSDALLITTNQDHGCDFTVTFDRKAGQLEGARRA